MAGVFRPNTYLTILIIGLALFCLLIFSSPSPCHALTPSLGLRWTTEQIAEWAVARILKHELLREGKLELSLKAPSLSDLRHRRLHTFSLTGERWVMRDGLPIESVSVALLKEKQSENIILAFTETDPPKLIHTYSFDLQATLSLRALNAFFSQPLGQQWLKTMQADFWGAFESVQLGQNGESLVFSGLWVPKLIGQWLKTPIQFSGEPRIDKGQIILDHPRLTIFGIKDSGEISRVANRFLRQLINPARHTIEGHHIAPQFKRIRLANHQLKVVTTLSVGPKK